MSDIKEIRTKIKSIKSTRKITNAMQMVAVSKMRKAEDRMRASRPYSDKIREVICHVANGRLEYKHPYLIERAPKRVGFMVISTDRGLCGGLNTNLFKATVESMKEWHSQNIPIDISSFGKKAEIFFKRLGGNVVSALSSVGDKPHIVDVLGAVKVMLDLYHAQKIDRLYLVYNRFVNTMTQKPIVELILPIVEDSEKTKQKSAKSQNFSWDYLYEPTAKPLIDALMVRYVESLIYQGVLENIACEQAARMVAMKNASDNATSLIDALQLTYNKARQAAITQEISEIVAGASAVSG